MGYCEYLRGLLAPLRYYELHEGLGGAELECEGARLDEVFGYLLEIEREAWITSAGDYGITLYEDIVPARPMSDSIEDRRAALMALLLIDGCGFTRDALNVTLRGCGINVVAEESDKSMTVNVHFPDVRGVPKNFAELQRRVEQILPCHLDVEYVMIYVLWHEIETLGSWTQLEEKLRSWEALEAYLAK